MLGVLLHGWSIYLEPKTINQVSKKLAPTTKRCHVPLTKKTSSFLNLRMEGEAAAESESLTCPATVRNPRKTKNKNRRRFSEEQTSTLESIFESETKLDPRRKLQLARELGLQPRQVAIWFQNRRARWKSKEIEQSYRVLKASYDSLYSQFECLKKENQSLLTQVPDEFSF